ncbi:PTS mannose transporter subunit IIA [Brachybacterium endophyticum]|uniref:Mannitol-specific phosphotransferase enzyme IIA component n=1 Tax=Brachybacterium endophyticum TaxID=2182385 RepID=A0A2U2RJZ1_9MICO|nr:PTS sugar transporter subunit IIA [Brachybacterium endophyticum]PWH06183.1 PTS mannose transporter subunit IIA [Brachybacterium endophyticum]
MTTTTETTSAFNPRVVLQKVGTSLSNMVMPNIPALIAWGIFTAFFIADGFTPVAALGGFKDGSGAEHVGLVTPMIHYLLPLLIANTGGRMVYEARGAVIGVVATMGVIAGSDELVAKLNLTQPPDQQIGQIHMFIGAMIMAPLAAWLMKKLDQLWQEKIPAGFEMLVNLFSAGIFSFIMALIGFYGLAPIVNGLMNLLGSGVEGLIGLGLLPLVSILIEPAKVFFLNNAINHGVLTPLGLTEASQNGKSVLFLLEANPGPGFGILLAYTIFGREAARASAPGAALIQFVGGIHEIYFPYVLMKPVLILAAIGGGMTGVFLNVLFHTGLRAPAAPGSIIAIFGNATTDSYLGIAIAVLGATVVSFVLAAILLRVGKQDDGDIASATAKMEQMKGKKSSVAGALTGGAAAGGAAGAAAAADDSSHSGPIERIVFACDAGMGSSAMGATVLRKKVRSAGFDDVEVTNKAISSLNDEWDVVVTQKELTDRARQRTGSAIHVSVDQFMNSPRYDEVVELVEQRNNPDAASADEVDATVGEGTAAAAGGAASAAGAANTHRAEAAPTGEQPSEAATATAEPSADAEPEILSASSIVLDGSAGSADAAIDEAGSLLVRAGAVENAYVSAMHDREATVSTFMGNGLAIPHGTNEAKESISRSAMSFVRYPQGIDWNGNPVTFVVGIAGVGNEHLSLLQNVAMTFSDPAQVERLEKATTEQEILDIFSEDKD